MAHCDVKRANDAHRGSTRMIAGASLGGRRVAEQRRATQNSERLAIAGAPRQLANETKLARAACLFEPLSLAPTHTLRERRTFPRLE